MTFEYAASSLFAAAFLMPLLAASAQAGEADVVGVEVHRQGDGAYRFDVTVRHDDEGWDHFADKWVVEDGDGAVLGERVLQHPHVNEQPFTRSLSGVSIPSGIDAVVIRAHDSVHEWGGAEKRVEIPE
ncbi:MAG: hypothetical protein RIM72_04790 [Alphaproteobacteria bacterium]